MCRCADASAHLQIQDLQIWKMYAIVSLFSSVWRVPSQNAEKRSLTYAEKLTCSCPTRHVLRIHCLGSNNETETQLGDFIEDKNSPGPSDEASYQLLREQIATTLHTLSEREAQVLQLRFGLIDGRIRTLEEVGKVFGVTRERIRQIEAIALRKLRHPSRSKKLRSYLEN